MKTPFVVASLAVLSILLSLPCVCSAQDATDANRKVVTKVIPEYPNLARAMNIQGNVRADVLVEPNGKVKSVQVKGGHPLLVQSAQDALRQWKWEPQSRETHEIVELKFTP
jgi:TonB family protein